MCVSGPEEAVENVSLKQEFNMKSACGTPKCTTKTLDFVKCIDYIFYQSDRLEVEQIVELPTDEELDEYEAIPSLVFPSDHIALVTDLKWTSKPIKKNGGKSNGKKIKQKLNLTDLL